MQQRLDASWGYGTQAPLQNIQQHGLDGWEYLIDCGDQHLDRTKRFARNGILDIYYGQKISYHQILFNSNIIQWNEKAEKKIKLIYINNFIKKSKYFIMFNKAPMYTDNIANGK